MVKCFPGAFRLNFFEGHCVFPSVSAAKQCCPGRYMDPDLAARLYPRQLALGAELVERRRGGWNPVIRQKTRLPFG